MKKIKKQIPLNLEMKYFKELAKHQADMGNISMTQAIKNLIMDQRTQYKASEHLLVLCGISMAVIVNLDFIQKSKFNEEENLERLKELNGFKLRINRIIRKYNY